MATNEVFSTSTEGLPAARPTTTIELSDGDSHDLVIASVAKALGDKSVRMLSYGGSVPGPILRVRQGSRVAVTVRNEADHETTVHWHGLRVDNAFDGVPNETQAPIPIGGSFTYRLHFPDDGLYWYHPHVREDYGLEMGLYGAIVVDPTSGPAWPPFDAEAVVTLDDVLLDGDHIAAFRTDGPTHTAMGRFGNVMLTAGETDYRLEARAGEIVRFFFVNTANTRIFDVAVGGARMKRIAGDSGRYERDEWVESVLLAPSERAVVDVRFEAPGSYPLEHRTPDRTYSLGSIEVAPGEAPGSPAADAFETLGGNAELRAEREAIGAALDREPDKTLTFVALMPLLYGDAAAEPTGSWTCPMHPEVVSDTPGTCPSCGMQLVPAAPGPEDGAAHEHQGEHRHDTGDGLEWEDLMPDINARTDNTNMVWKLVDSDSGAENHAIDWRFRVGDRVKVRLVNTMDSEHPMHHPFHIHGAGRFLVLRRGETVEPNLVWKDTVLVRAGETVDILFAVTNPGLWMAHCHIAEHNQNGMMFSFVVES